MSSDLNNISPIDGRYRSKSEAIAPFFSERALMSYRIRMEAQYLTALSNEKGVDVRAFTKKEEKILHALPELSEEDAQIIKDIEVKGYKDIPATNHDVKAIEYYMKLRLAETSLSDVTEWIHFALTSEDTNNITYALMLSDALEQEIIPNIESVHTELQLLAKEHKDVPMLARTHGQSASPTTFGKEMNVFAYRIGRYLKQLEEQTILVKLSGATGNYNAHAVAYPSVDWQAFTKQFARDLNVNRKIQLEVNPVTTQIEPHDAYVDVFDVVRKINMILIDFNQDMWRYISDGWVTQKPKEGEVGSSTMPHKVNPIDFENSEGNLGLANALFIHFAQKLPISRLQRDLSDSTVERNFGTAFAHSLVAYQSTLKGLGKIKVNEDAISKTLDSHPEVVAEAIQTVLRKEGVPMPYEALKKLTRGKQITMEDISNFIDDLDVAEGIKKDLKKITPENYIGLASKIAEID